jgi:DNA (cytosine-5)-methyltransferase 1
VPGAYYNELDGYCAEWLRNLIAEGHIAPGDVDERDIRDVHPDDLRGYTQCHFFAGIGVWSAALRRAGWSDDRPVWTGSCPCQPFSAAGKGLGFDDERHLWPAWHWLIGECRPPIIFGEQVASAAVEPWIDLVQADVEGMDYAYGCIPFPSASVGAPHIRDRVLWMGYANGIARGQGRSLAGGRHSGSDARSRAGSGGAGGAGGVGGVAHGHGHGRVAQAVAGFHDPERDAQSRCGAGRLDDAKRERFDSIWIGDNRRHDGQLARAASERSAGPGPTNGFWRAADWLLCRDGKWRPVEPGTFPLVNGAPARVGRLRAYGNAINLEQAAEFIGAAREAIEVAA